MKERASFNDLSGNENNATINNGALWSNDVFHLLARQRTYRWVLLYT